MDKEIVGSDLEWIIHGRFPGVPHLRSLGKLQEYPQKIRNLSSPNAFCPVSLHSMVPFRLKEIMTCTKGFPISVFTVEI